MRGEVKVVDFGIAVQVARARELVGMAAGTVEYMAPELLMGKPPSIAADLYAVGVIGFELLTEAFPFARRSRTHLLEQVLGTRADVTLPDHVAAMFSSASAGSEADGGEARTGQKNPAFDANLAKLDVRLQGILRKLLAREPEKRYGSAESLFVDLNGVLAEPLPVETVEIRESFLRASRLVGRDAVLAQFAEAISAVTSVPGHPLGRGVLLGGESGVGKSRLLEEVRSLALVQGMLVVRGQSVAAGSKALHVFRDVLRHLCLYMDLEPLEAGVLKSVMPELPALLGRAIADAPIVDAQAAQSRLLSVIEALLRRQVQPTLIVLEDLHWADAESLTLLRRVANWLAQSSLIIIGSYRHDERPNLPNDLGGFASILLPRLTSADIAELTRAILGVPGSDAKLVALLDRETAGNPHFVVEAMRLLADEAGHLDSIGQKQLPQTLLSGGMQEVLRRRLKRVPEVARPMLQLAAIIGRQLDLRVITALLDQSPHPQAIEPLLRACAEVSILEVSDDTWRFTHDRLRDRLLADLSADERRALHLRTGNAMEAIYRDVPGQAAVLAHHFQQAGERSRSAHYMLQAGELALQAGALSEAATLLATARDLQAHLDVSPLQRARVLRMLASALWGLGRFSESLPLLEHALSLLGAPPARGGLRIGASLLGLSGRQLLHRLLPRSIGVHKPRSEEERQVLAELLQVILGSGEMYAWVGDQTQLLLGALLSLNLAEILDDGPSLVMMYAVMGFMGEMLHLPALRDHYLALAEARLSTVNDVKSEAELYRITAALHVMKGQWGSAQRLYDRAITLSRSLGNQPIYFFNLTQRATVHYWRGDYAAADVDVAQLLDEARRDGFPQYQVWALGTVGALALRRDALLEARKALDEGITIARKEQAIPSQIFIAGLRALATLRLGDRNAARRMADETLVDIGRTAHTGHGALEGYLSTLETYLELAESEPSENARKELLSIIAKMLPGTHRYARLIPIGGARAALLDARYQALRGKYDAALKALRQSLAVAQRCDLPYDEALAHRFLAWLAPQGSAKVKMWPDPRVHRAAALQLFTRIGAVDVLRNGDR